MAVNNFDVLKRMGEENKSIQLCTTITQMNYSAKKGGTEISIGVPGNVCFEINSGERVAFLLLYNVRQFNELKSKMEKEELSNVSNDLKELHEAILLAAAENGGKMLEEDVNLFRCIERIGRMEREINVLKLRIEYDANTIGKRDEALIETLETEVTELRRKMLE